MSVLPALALFPLLLTAAPVPSQDPPPAPPVEIRLPQPDSRGASERNVRVDVTVTVKSAETSVSKSLSLIAADNRMVLGRAGVQLPIVTAASTIAGAPSAVQYRDVGLNVDATPRILPSGKISVSLKLNFSNVLQIRSGGTERPSFGNGSHESNAIMFDSGKMLTVLEGGDPESGRHYTVQVTATILK
jgi:hypothetical protein